MKYLILLMFVSCASTSQMVEEIDNGGRVMILGSKGVRAEEGVKHAKARMLNKCPSGYKVIKTGWMTTSSINPNQAMDEEKFFEFRCK